MRQKNTLLTTLKAVWVVSEVIFRGRLEGDYDGQLCHNCPSTSLWHAPEIGKNTEKRLMYEIGKSRYSFWVFDIIADGRGAHKALAR